MFDEHRNVGMTEQRFPTIERPTPEYWRVTFDHPPINLLTVPFIDELRGLVDRIDAEPDAHVDRFARRIASFDKHPLAAVTSAINSSTQASDTDMLGSARTFRAALTWPEARERAGRLFAAGLQQRGDTEYRLGEHIAP